MRYHYKIEIEISGNGLPGIKDRLAEINQTAHDFGVPSDVNLVTTHILPFELSVSRQPTTEEMERINTKIVESLSKSLPGSTPKLKTFRLVRTTEE